MTTLELAKEYGPAALSIVGTVVGAVVSVFAFLAKQVWKTHTARMNNLIKATQDLAKGIRDHEKSTEERFTQMDSIVQGLRAELHLAQQKFDHIRVGLMGCEANIKSQQNTITEHIRELAKIDSKLEAVFRFMDAPKRSSDVR